MSIYSKHFNQKETPQTEEVLGKNQVQNNADGFVFALTPQKQFERFLILGSEGGTYYASERKLTQENARVAIEYIRTNGADALRTICDVSDSGRAPKNDPAIFALALVCTYGDEGTKRHAYDSLSQVCRTGTHLFTFLQCIQSLRGWSRGLRRTVAAWYTGKKLDQLDYQLIKYRQRNGWTHRDALRLSHPRGNTAQNDRFKYAVGKWEDKENYPSEFIEAFEVVQTLENPKDIVHFIVDYKLPWEALPTEALKHSDVWAALLQNMPLHAMIRNLGKMTSLGLLKVLTPENRIVQDRLLDETYLKKSRMHPLTILNALRTYASGHGIKGNLTWDPAANLIDSLDRAFYLAFGNVTPTNKRISLNLDISGSMTWNAMAGTSLTPLEAESALALVTATVEPNHIICGFADTIRPLAISPKQRLDDVLSYMRSLDFGQTDCSLPMLFAATHKLDVDTFIVYTDSETYAGSPHPFQSLQRYRKFRVRDAKLCVVGMTSTQFTIADPSDAGMLDIVGFDLSTPELISNFISEPMGET